MTPGRTPGEENEGGGIKVRRGLWRSPQDADQPKRTGSKLDARLAKLRKRTRLAMGVVGLVSIVFGSVLLSALRVARDIGDDRAERAAWLGLSILVGANILSIALFRAQQKVLDKVRAELDAKRPPSDQP